MFSRQQAAQHLAALLDHTAKNEAVRAREINVLEYALLPRFFRSEAPRLDARFIYAQHFAGFYVAHVGGAKQVECARF